MLRDHGCRKPRRRATRPASQSTGFRAGLFVSPRRSRPGVSPRPLVSTPRGSGSHRLGSMTLRAPPRFARSLLVHVNRSSASAFPLSSPLPVGPELAQGLLGERRVHRLGELDELLLRALVHEPRLDL